MRLLLREIFEDLGASKEVEKSFDFLPIFKVEEEPKKGIAKKKQGTFLPIKPGAPRWSTTPDKKRLERIFSFESKGARDAFIHCILDAEYKLSHNINFACDDYDVTVTLYTKGVGIITELDVEASDYLSKCAIDVAQSGF